MKRLNNKGSIVLVATMILYFIILIGVSFTLANLNELSFTKRFYHGKAAFWLAEAGLNMYIANPFLLDDKSTKEFNYGDGTIILTKDTSQPNYQYIYSTGTYGSQQRKLQITYPAAVPEAFKSVFATNGNVSIDGTKTSAVVYGQSNVAGEITGTSKYASVSFEALLENADSATSTLNYPKNTPDDFKNFNEINNNLISQYKEQEVLHIKDTDTVTLTPEQVKGKKIIYVEGYNERTGNVVINTNSLVSSNQNVTIIASGNVTFNQNGNQAPNSQLNIIAWGGYQESVSAASSHRGLIYTHGIATFDNIKESSTTSGGVIAEGGIVLGDIWSTKIFNYADMTKNGFYPPGFEMLSGGSLSNVDLKPSAWKEIRS